MELRFGSIRKWKSKLTSGAMTTQTYALIPIGKVLEVTATIAKAKPVSCNPVVSRRLRVTAVFPWTVLSNQILTQVS